MGKKQDWYAKSPADYKMDTGRLNLMEHGAYNLLLDRYYHDGFLPSDVQQLLNVCSTRDEHEEQAVKRVVGMFFEIRGDRLWHKRVEDELNTVRELRVKKSAAGKESARVRGMTRKGISTDVEQRSTITVQNSTEQDSTKDIPAGPSGPRSAGAEHALTPLQNAVENPTPVDTIESNPVKAESSKELKKSAREILAYLNRATGKKFQDVDSNLEPIIARLKEGASPENIKSVVAERVQVWGADEKMHEFLRPDTLFRRTKFWNYLGNITVLDKESSAGVESTSRRLTERQPGEDDES